MKIWLLLLIPTLFIAVIMSVEKLRKELHYLEVLILYAICAVVIFISKITSETIVTNDTERLVEYVVSVEHHDYWNEWITKTCSRSCCCYRDSKGVEHCGTETYDCSYEEEYSPYTEITTNTGRTIRYYEGYEPDGHGSAPFKYIELCNLFKTNKIKIDDRYDDLYRDHGKGFHGEVFKCDRDVNSGINTIEPITIDNTYENRIQASSSIFKFEELDTTSVKFYGLFEYPEYYTEYKSQCILGYKSNELDFYANQKNALIGKSKQLKVYFLVFKDKSQKSALLQEQYWKGGNKNEAVICIGIDSKNNITWSHVFSWSDKSSFKVNISADIMKHNILNDVEFKNIIDESYSTLEKEFKRKEFADFSYITVEPSGTAIIISTILVIISCIGILIVLLKNEFKNY